MNARIKAVLSALSYVLTVIAIVAGSTVAAWALEPKTPAPLPPCVTEDDPGDCYWDANVRGNGLGASFVHYRGRYYFLDT